MSKIWYCCTIIWHCFLFLKEWLDVKPNCLLNWKLLFTESTGSQAAEAAVPRRKTNYALDQPRVLPRFWKLALNKWKAQGYHSCTETNEEALRSWLNIKETRLTEPSSRCNRALPDLVLPPRVLLDTLHADAFPFRWCLGQGPGGKRVATLKLDNLENILLKRLFTKI